MGDPPVTTTYTSEAQATPIELPLGIHTSWAGPERAAARALLLGRHHLGWVDSARDWGSEAIADTKDAVAAAEHWTNQQVADAARRTGEAADAVGRGVEDSVDWAGKRIADGADMAGAAVSDMADGAEDTADSIGKRAKEAWHGANPFE